MSAIRRRDGQLTPAAMASWPAVVIRALEAQGVDGRELAVRAGIPLAALADPDGRVPSLAVARLFQLAAEATGDPAFGLSAARFVQQTTFSALGYAMLASRTPKEALERLIRHRRVIGDLVDLRLEEASDRYRVVIRFRGAFPCPDPAVEAGAAIIVRAARLLRAQRDLHPLLVQLQRPRPDDVGPYSRFFRSPIAFGQPRTVLEFSRADIDAPLPSGHVALARHNDEVVVRYLDNLASSSVSHRVQELLLDALPGRAPTKREVARRLGMSARNLQRHLGAEGQTFKALLRQTRLVLANGYLSEGRLSIKEIAFRLGFTGGSAFSRAFRRWAGRAPGEHAQRRNRRPAPPGRRR
jgi:AraC-like DNA-binding protein